MVGNLSQHYYTRQPDFEIEHWRINREGGHEVLLSIKEGYTFDISIVVGIEDLEHLEDMIRDYRKHAGLIEAAQEETEAAG